MKNPILLKFPETGQDLHNDLRLLTAVTGNTLSKEIRIAISNHLEFYQMGDLCERALKNNRSLHEEIMLAIKQYMKPKRWWKR